jgi:hypothetical protein
MRLHPSIAIIGSLAFAAIASAQALTEHAAAAAGATVGTAAGKPVSNALENIFGQVDQVTATATGGKVKPKTTPKSEMDSDPRIQALRSQAPATSGDEGSIGSAPATPRARARARASQVPLKVVPITLTPAEPPAPEVKQPTLEDLASIKIGESAQEVQAALGTPASHVSIPDDGHLRESCQYWANGKMLGTVRLDNGQVVKVELNNEN